MLQKLNNVLLVDDDTVTNLMHRRQIKRHSFARTVDVATNGQAALDFLQERLSERSAVPELVLLDINMPRMNGFEFLQHYARLPESLRRSQCVIMVSTSTLHRDRVRAEADPHVKAYQVKPLEYDDFIDIIALCQSVKARPN